MTYATAEDLAAALRVAVTPKNQAQLDRSLAAAAQEIDHYVDRLADDPIPPDDPLAGSVNIARGVEWFKASDAAFGAVGFSDIGVLAAPADPFARHARALIPLKRQFGVG